MLEFHANKGPKVCGGVSRRDFLKAGSLGAGAVSLSLADLEAAGRPVGDVNCILLFLVGGPSQLDTWDPKPAAPSNVRGPFRPIATSVPGVTVCEHFPQLARRMDRVAILRSVHHDAAPIHETGHQLMQTGRLFRGGQEYPHYGSVVSALRGSRAGVPANVLLPRPIGNTGVSVSHGQGAASLGAAYEPFVVRADPARTRSRTELLDAVDSAHRAFDAAPRPGAGIFGERAKQAFDLVAEPEDARARYGRNTFGQSCLLARRLVEHGVRFVTVNMFDTVFNEVTWDCHADDAALPATLDDYASTLCPMFDRAYAALLDDLHERGMLSNTLVVATGEFGRTPQLNARGGRDHWPGVWSVLFAGANVRAAQVVGASDRLGGEPRDCPATPARVAATIYRALGIPLGMTVPTAAGEAVPLVEAAPIAELLSV